VMQAKVFRLSFQLPTLSSTPEEAEAKQQLSSCGEGVRKHRALDVETGGQGIAAKLSVFET
jgi:hypothetical protein